MRRRGAALVEFGLVAGILIMLMSSVGALYPAIGAKTTVVDAALAAGLEASTYQPPAAGVAAGLTSLATQRAILCRNAALVAHRVLVAGGLPLPAAAPTTCGAASAIRPLGIVISDLSLTGVIAPAPKSPFTLCVTYRYAPDGGIGYFISSGPLAIDAENLTHIDLRACTAVYLDNGLETP
jgi:hypothetical protein